jgi:TonB family protein
MRRMLFAVFAITLATVPAGVTVAQVQDPIVVSARQLSQKGDHDAALKMLRSTLAAHPKDENIKRALIDVLTAKRQALLGQVSELEREVATLLPPPLPRTVAGCTAGMPVRVGGNIRTPMKVHDVKPIYPPLAQSAGVQGIIILEAVIGCDGRIAEAKILRGQPLLNDAALEAVRQWEYTPTLLNGVPVPVIMTMTVTFTVQN